MIYYMIRYNVIFPGQANAYECNTVSAGTTILNAVLASGIHESTGVVKITGIFEATPVTF